MYKEYISGSQVWIWTLRFPIAPSQAIVTLHREFLCRLYIFSILLPFLACSALPGFFNEFFKLMSHSCHIFQSSAFHACQIPWFTSLQPFILNIANHWHFMLLTWHFLSLCYTLKVQFITVKLIHFYPPPSITSNLSLAHPSAASIFQALLFAQSSFSNLALLRD